LEPGTWNLEPGTWNLGTWNLGTWNLGTWNLGTLERWNAERGTLIRANSALTLLGSGASLSPHIVARLTAALDQRSTKDKLDLTVEAAQVIVGPALQRVEHRLVDPQKKGLAFSHEITRRRPLDRPVGYW
jgi:hypothetical protein